MTVVVEPPWRPGTKAAARREAAVQLVLEGRSLAEAREELKLNVFDESRVAVHLRNLAHAEPYEPPAWQPGPAVMQREFRADPRPPHVAAALTAFRACVGLRPEEAQPGHEEVAWAEPTERMARVRVLENTCEQCRAISYELCAAGGRRFIRRTDRTKTPPEVTETEHLPAAQIDDLWRRLLNGQAR